MDARPTAEDLIKAEVARQNRMWGAVSERPAEEVAEGELAQAALAQLEETVALAGGDAEAFNPSYVPFDYPDNWDRSAFRSYGTVTANLVVAAAFLQQEIQRRLNAGDDFTRTSRNLETQPYRSARPAVIEI